MLDATLVFFLPCTTPVSTPMTCIPEVVLEVHDVDGRLASVVELLRSEPAAFEEVCWEPVVTSEVRGYVMVVPRSLRLFLVFGKRRNKPAGTREGLPTGPRGPADAARDPVRGDEVTVLSSRGDSTDGDAAAKGPAENEGSATLVGDSFCCCLLPSGT